MKMDLEQIAWQGVNWIYKVQDIEKWQATVNMLTNVQVP
jgi:hypothetical protein